MLSSKNKCVLSGNGDDFVCWLVEKLGPVLFGSKPGELLSFSSLKQDTPEKIYKIEKSFCHCNRIAYKIFRYKDSGVKVFFYNPTSLDRNLRDSRNKRFLQGLGYPKNYSMDSFIEVLVSKIQDGEIPPEIGLFLGYPLKDILGFIGHPSLKLTKVNGWRVYGDPRLSDIKYNEFTTDRDQVKELLKFSRPESILVSF